MANPVPLKISPILTTRDGTSATKDSRYTNLLIEERNGELHFVKRPGYSTYGTATSSASPALGAIPLPNSFVLAFSGTGTTATIDYVPPVVPPPVSVFSTFDPTAKSARITLSNGNLTATGDGTNNFQAVKATDYKTLFGQYYCEFHIDTTGTVLNIGLVNLAASTSVYVGFDLNGYGYQSDNGAFKHNNGTVGSGATYTTGDVISVLFDAVAQTVVYWKNGVTQGTAFTSVSGSWTPAISLFGTAGIVTAKFGASGFTYTPPAGYTGWGS